MFLNLAQEYHSDIDIIVELADEVINAEMFETTGQYVKTKYKVKVINRGNTLYTKSSSDPDSFNFKAGQNFDLEVSEALYNKMKPFNEGETILIRFVTKGAKNKFWKVEAVNPDSLPSQDINSDINEDYEKQKIKNRLQNSNRISTTDDRIAWAVAINNATKLVSHINCKIDEKIELIEESTARIYELVKSLDTYLNNQTEENNEKSEEPYKSPVE
tara:strand:- start:459 stop:1106 length:648 start_codon:yes stop_codon:yes gene_type:complete